MAPTARWPTRYFVNADGEMLIVPQQGALRVITELGVLEVAPGEIALMPRGMQFKVDLPDGPSRGYVCENYGAAVPPARAGPDRLQRPGQPRDFLAPVAAYEDEAGAVRAGHQVRGRLWAAEMAHSPFNVVAWHGNLAPYKYDMRAS